MGEVSVDASPMVAMSVTGGGRVAVLSGLKPSDQHVSMMTVDLSGKRSEKSQTEVGEEGNGGGGGGGGDRGAPAASASPYGAAGLPRVPQYDTVGALAQVAGTTAWLHKTPRGAADSTVTLSSSSSGITADIDVWGMGCGWLTPSYTDSPTL